MWAISQGRTPSDSRPWTSTSGHDHTLSKLGAVGHDLSTDHQHKKLSYTLYSEHTFDDKYMSPDQQCPTTCVYNVDTVNPFKLQRSSIKVTHFLRHPGQAHQEKLAKGLCPAGESYCLEGGPNQNKVYHKCYHRYEDGGIHSGVGQRKCRCECAIWGLGHSGFSLNMGFSAAS